MRMNEIKLWIILTAVVLLPCRANAAAAAITRQTYADTRKVRIEVSGASSDTEFRISTAPYGNYADWTQNTRKRSASEYELTGLYEGSRYYIRLGNGRPHAVVTAPKGRISAPAQTGCGRNYVTLSWTEVPHADAYRISGLDAAGHIFDEHVVKNAYGRIKLPRQDERYRIRIVPLKTGANFGAEGTQYESGLTFRTRPGKLKAPVYKKNRLGSGKAYFTWDMSAAASGYEYQISDSRGRKLFSGSSTKPAAWIKDRRLADGAFYGIRVRGTVALAEGTASGKWSAKTWFCGNVQNVRLQKNGSTIKITWKKTKGAGSYRIYVSDKAPDRLSRMKCVKTVRKTHFALKKYCGKALKSSRKYYIAVAAVKKAGGKTYASRPRRYYYLG